MSHARGLPAVEGGTIAAVVGCLIPAFPSLDGATRTAVVADVTRFVSSQVEALPGFLRLPYKLALIGFAWLPIVRWGRPFAALTTERQIAYVALWAGAPVGAMRNFIKLIRGCALLAYYDHPALVAVLETEAGRTTVHGATGNVA